MGWGMENANDCVVKLATLISKAKTSFSLSAKSTFRSILHYKTIFRTFYTTPTLMGATKLLHGTKRRFLFLHYPLESTSESGVTKENSLKLLRRDLNSDQLHHRINNSTEFFFFFFVVVGDSTQCYSWIKSLHLLFGYPGDHLLVVLLNFIRVISKEVVNCSKIG
jgi:hypothetical protein